MALQNISDPRQHRRTKSSVLSNISFIHKRIPSTGSTLDTRDHYNTTNIQNVEINSYLPQDHFNWKALGERQNNQQSHQPQKSDAFKTETRGMKKSISHISLKSLSRKEDNQDSKKTEIKSGKSIKQKSSTNFASFLTRPKSLTSINKEIAEESSMDRDKENKLPLRTPGNHFTTEYDQYSNKHYSTNLKHEINLYTPREYSPGKQRNFYEFGNRPTLGKREEAPSRPRSTYLPGSFSIQDISKCVNEGSRHSAELIRKVSGKNQRSGRKKSGSISKSEKSNKPIVNCRNRVLAAVSSSFGSKIGQQSEDKCESAICDNDVNREFEAMLDRRNIPDHQRAKMRNLAVSLKKDFIRQDWAEIAALKNSKLESNSRDTGSSVSSAGSSDGIENKTKRPRSRTFTLSIGGNKDSIIGLKRGSSDLTTSKNLHKKSNESLHSGGKTLTTVGTAVAQNLLAKAKGQTPDEFVFYLTKVSKPEVAEVGRLHKLRLLLRNESVAWTDNFIRLGGMEEIVDLLYKTLAIEWREEHEDTLLHEVLLCLKGLSTTELALKYLEKMQEILFPALIHMLFDEEKKGPSEFTTRNIVTSLLFTFLKSAPTLEREERARTILSYLRDPEKDESQRPIGFVLEMRRPRPYRVWCKEVVNVTKEVFWIFLHNLNVIAIPGSHPDGNYSRNDSTDSHSVTASLSSSDASKVSHSYMIKHFPQERPPIPAAPYVGGVEWDATNYLASHLDLVNGMIACLTSCEERNSLREQMLVSGWEKCMGGTLRLCKEKFYGSVHAGLSCWVAAATDDNWDTKFVRCGPRNENQKCPTKEPTNTESPKAPKIALDFMTDSTKSEITDNWL